MKRKFLIIFSLFAFLLLPNFNVFAYAPLLTDYSVSLQGISITSFRQNIWVPAGGTVGTLKIDISTAVPTVSDVHKFGYIALCRTPVSTGNLSYYDSSYYENVQMINSDTTCNNFNTNGVGKVVYFIFAMNLDTPWSCSVQLENCIIDSRNSIVFTEYQGATYSLYGYGFSNERFEYNNVNGSLSTLGVGIQNVNGNISITNQKLDTLGTILNNNQTATNQKLDNLDNTMKDDNIDTSYQNSTLDNLNTQMASNNVISDLLLLPVRMYQKILDSLGSDSCVAYNLGTLYGTNLQFPCIQVQNYIGSALWTTIDLIFCGMFILVIRKKFVDIFNHMTNLKDGGNEIE